MSQNLIYPCIDEDDFEHVGNMWIADLFNCVTGTIDTHTAPTKRELLALIREKTANMHKNLQP